MLQVTVPSSLGTVRRYIVDVLLGEFLGLPYRMVVDDGVDGVQISNEGRVLTIADQFLPQASEAWLRPESLPRRPLPKWQVARELSEIPLVEPVLPVICGAPTPEDRYLEVHERDLKLHLDVFGSSFFMLSRYEEAVRPDRDEHDRFPACGSLAHQEGFLARPIVNEYVEVLWACLKRLWPRLERKKREFRVMPSHDVDRPFAYAFRSPYRMARNLAGDVLKRHAPMQAVRNLIQTVRVKTSRPDLDPCNNFDWIMDVSESEGLGSAFYFIADRTAAPHDADYSMTHPLIRRLLRQIHDRGHEIGLHASYSTYQDQAQTASEFEALKAACSAEGIRQESWGSRQHYLRWDTSRTVGNLNDAGLDYDTTLSFADVAGFRCGTCYEYPTFDLQRRVALDLRERPLIVMECTVTDEPYMNLGKGDAALEHMLALKRACRQFGGDFTLLWHNSSLLGQDDIALYQAILRG